MLVYEEKLDPRVKRTRQLLQHALMDLAHEKPLDSITVQDIAARAEVNRATFYAHFEDKYALMSYTLREMFLARLDEKLPGTPTFTWVNLRSLILTTCEFLGDFLSNCAPVHTVSDQAVMFIQLQVHLCEMLTGWLKESPGSAAGSIAPEMIAMTNSWAIWGSVFQWARAGRKIPAARLTDQILTLLTPGLQPYLVDGE